MNVLQSADRVHSAGLLAGATARTDNVEESVAFAATMLLVGTTAIESSAMEAAYSSIRGTENQSASYAQHSYSTEAIEKYEKH